MLKLFSDITRTDLAPAEHAEPRFAYLDRSGRLQMQRTRNVLESWFSHYPGPHRNDLKRRFEASVENHFLSAFFELYLHELLLRLGCSIELPSQGPRQSRRPDFLVHSQSGPDYYVEAVLADDNSAKDAAKEAIINQVCDRIDKIDSPDFFVEVSPTGSPSTQPSSRKIAVEIENWLGSLDPDAVREQYEQGGRARATLPVLHQDLDGWEIDFRAIPKSSGTREKRGVRLIGMRSSGVKVSNAKEAIRDAVRGKVNYENLEKPYIVAVNSLSLGTDHVDIVEALFGSEVWTISLNEPDAQPVASRERDGVWLGMNGPINTRVSGVLVISRLVPWSISESDLTIYHNPWASQPYSGEMNRLSKVTVQPDGTLRWEAGIHPRELFGIPEGWPERDE